jgi:uroporphyrinogen-III synthase
VTAGEDAARIWVTRAQPGADATASRLSGTGLGIVPVVAPLIETTPLEVSPEPLHAHDALVFTSAAAVRCVADLSDDRSLPVFAVGEATARAARAAGWTEVQDADGAVTDLARLLRADGRRHRLLHPCAAVTAGDLSDVGVTPWPVYRTDDAATGWEAALADLLAGRMAGVLVQSPSAGRALAARLGGSVPGGEPVLFALSPACAGPLLSSGFREIASPPFPREAALLKVVADSLAGAPPAASARP